MLAVILLTGLLGVDHPKCIAIESAIDKQEISGGIAEICATDKTIEIYSMCYTYHHVCAELPGWSDNDTSGN